MSVQIYENALDQARNDLAWINSELEKLRVRKELLDSSVGALTSLISHFKAVEEHATPHDQPAHQ
jgi:hypothetical protein